MSRVGVVVIADTSGVLAALDEADPEHNAASFAMNSAGLLVISGLLLAELDHVATRELGRDAAMTMIDDIRHWLRRGRIAMPELTDTHLGTAQAVRIHYRGLNLDLADGIAVALARDYDTDAVLTLDRRDFRAMRPLGSHTAFRLLPDDL